MSPLVRGTCGPRADPSNLARPLTGWVGPGRVHHVL
ncbi:unnamed protein product [Spirodela intermedia]|uniref:Uncharacterized protein n=2 Tax=Spirodela intermedia TaxID=51605 RepID=A0A7I8IZ88_SPIIN|nr:unnamed protein product [Spirodela intermedia]CAA6663207.1 unnamed protein product [Spirodela intermedia]CAA7399652.1 unnamed protein product [Spirodela intermedia]